MTRTPNRQWILKQRPSGKPIQADFELNETDRPTPGPQEVLIQTRFLSVDPYMRGRMRDRESYAEPWAVGDVMRARVVGEVIESNHPDFSPGDFAAGNLNWADYSVATGGDLVHVNPDLAPISTALGVIGMPGRTAFFGLFDVGNPHAGETVVVSAAAGAVGSVVGQLARLNGCRVIGIAGSDTKTAFLTEELGFDHAINYAIDNVAQSVGEYAPDGVDVYFDNVGGSITDSVLEYITLGARIVVCGQIALYNEEETATGPRHFWKLIHHRAKIEGFLVSDYANDFETANEYLARWVNQGELTYRETITEGLEHAPDAFIGLFDGENIGKQLVQVSDSQGKIV